MNNFRGEKNFSELWSDSFLLNIYYQPIRIKIYLQTISNGSRSRWETINLTWLEFQICSKWFLITFKYPRSVFVWSQRMTVVPRCIASNTAWWDSSPVNCRSTFRAPENTLEPEPAQTARVFIGESSVLLFAKARRICFRPVNILTFSMIWRIVRDSLNSIKRPYPWRESND